MLGLLRGVEWGDIIIIIMKHESNSYKRFDEIS